MALNGSVKWDDENHLNRNQALGTLPHGDYTEDTVIFYCCQNQSTWHDVIELPTTSPFYLLPYQPPSHNSIKCQRVKWALATLEYIQFYTEDHHNQDMFHGHHVAINEGNDAQPMVYYCYYESR